MKAFAFKLSLSLKHVDQGSSSTVLVYTAVTMTVTSRMASPVLASSIATILASGAVIRSVGRLVLSFPGSIASSSWSFSMVPNEMGLEAFNNHNIKLEFQGKG